MREGGGVVKTTKPQKHEHLCWKRFLKKEGLEKRPHVIDTLYPEHSRTKNNLLLPKTHRRTTKYLIIQEGRVPKSRTPGVPKSCSPSKKSFWSRRQFGPVLRVPKRVIIGTKGVHIKDPVVKLVK